MFQVIYVTKIQIKGDKENTWEGIIKDGIYSMSNFAEIIEVSVETLYEWNRKGYLIDFIVKSIVRDINFAKADIKKVEVEMEKILRIIDCKLTTILGVQTVTACALLSEIADISRFKTPDKLA